MPDGYNPGAAEDLAHQADVVAAETETDAELEARIRAELAAKNAPAPAPVETAEERVARITALIEAEKTPEVPA
jgi:hypothetical protein